MTTIPYEPKSIKPPEIRRLALEDIQEKINRLRMAQADPKCSYDPSFTDPQAAPPPPYEDVPHPKGIRSIANFDLNSLATSEDIINLQNQANAYIAKRRQGLDLRNMTVKTAMHDVYEATFGIARDVFRNDRNEPVSIDTFTKNDRLRGLGILLIVVALLSFI